MGKLMNHHLAELEARQMSAITNGTERKMTARMPKKFGLDIYRDGAWTSAPCDFSSINNARVFMGDSVEHFHIWFDGACVFDSKPGEPEPANIAEEAR